MSEESIEVEKPSLLGMITSPTEQFERIKARPVIWGAMVVIIILSMVGSWLTTIGIEFEGLDEELEGLVQIIKIIGIILAGVLIPLLGVLVSSVVHFLIAKITHSTVSFKQLFSMNTYITIISVIGLVFNGIIFAIINGDPGRYATSLGSILNSEGTIGAIFNSIEVFSIWIMILTAIGLHKVAGFSKGLAWAVPIILFIIGIITAISGANLPGV